MSLALLASAGKRTSSRFATLENTSVGHGKQRGSFSESGFIEASSSHLTSNIKLRAAGGLLAELPSLSMIWKFVCVGTTQL